MARHYLALIAVLLVGCATTPPPLDCEGELVPINAPLLPPTLEKHDATRPRS